ncbi:MAG TPA: GtrA family protein [Terriglobales bacterium]|nr:GtrA family protein [Terriglobales bacterium]
MVIRSDGWIDLAKRWLKFHMVGFLGMGVQLCTLPVLKSGFGLDYLWATALAVEAAVLHNFAWHERFTWKDRCSVCFGQVLRRLLRFNFTTGLISIVGNLVIMRYLVGQHHVPYLMANLIAIGCCSVLNFLASDFFVFRKAAPDHEMAGTD